MKGRLTTLRRSAVAVGLSLSMVVAAGASAKAAGPVTTLKTYSASARSRSLHVSLQLQGALQSALNQVGGTLNGVLAGTPLAGAGDLLNGIDESISFSSADAIFDSAKHQVQGDAVGKTFDGTLDTLISHVLNVPATLLAGANVTVQGVAQNLKTSHVPIASVPLPSAAMPVIKLGIGDQLANAATQVTSAISSGHADLASIDVSLAPLTSALDAAGVPVSQTLQTLTTTVNGLIGQINQQIPGVLQSAGLSNLLGQLQIPGLPDLTKVSILHVGIMDGVANTTVDRLSHALANGATEMRRAHSVNELAGVDILGGLVHIDVLKTTADAALDNLAGNPSANADVQILGLKVGNIPVSVGLDKIVVGNTVVNLGSTLSDTLNKLVNNVAGITITGPTHTTKTGPGLATADAQSLSVSVAPAGLFNLSLTGPLSTASVGLATTAVEGKTIYAKTGLNDTMYVLYGVIFLAAAVLVRRFALSNK